MKRTFLAQEVNWRDGKKLGLVKLHENPARFFSFPLIEFHEKCRSYHHINYTTWIKWTSEWSIAYTTRIKWIKIRITYTARIKWTSAWISKHTTHLKWILAWISIEHPTIDTIYFVKWKYHDLTELRYSFAG